MRSLEATGFVAKREAPRASPTAIEETINEVPPAEIKGKVMPLGGASPALT